MLSLIRSSCNQRVNAPVVSRLFSNNIANIKDQVVGREREELLLEDQGITLFNRDPIVTKESDGTKQNPILVPSFEKSRPVGISHNDSPYLMWFNLEKGKLHYVPDVDKYFKLYNPSEEN